MRLGLSDAILPERMDLITAELARRVRELGFSGVFTRFTEHDPFAVTEAQCRRVRELFEAEGVAMFQATGYRPALVHPDESARREASRTLREALRIAGQLGARAIDTGPGSMSPRGPWFPDPYNYTPQALEQLVKSVRECVGAAEEHGVLLCLEGHQLVTLRSAEVMREVIDAVDSPWVRVDFDPVNWITLETVYETGPAIGAMLETLGDRIASAHVKDVFVEDRMVVHIEHCASGKGILDTGAVLRGIERLDPEAPVIVEALSDDEVPEVRAFLMRVAEENGITVLD
jgi:sugar phosphate isomerase/epimerase